MRKNRTAKFIFNGALLAVMAVLESDRLPGCKQTRTYSGSASIGKAPGKNDTAKADGANSTDDSSLAEAGTNMVEADLDGISDTGILDSESLINESIIHPQQTWQALTIPWT